MERRAVIAGIWVLAAAVGIVGYQTLTYYFYGYWQPVTVSFIWAKLVGPWPAGTSPAVEAVAEWCGRLPLLAVGIALGYLCFLVADSVRQPPHIRDRRLPSGD